jgi:hypothetical protein
MSGSKLSDPIPSSKNQVEPAVDAPLGLTVHSMPTPADVALTDGARTRVGRWKMLFVLLICASPVIASYWTYYVLRPEGRRNFGELIQPQRPLPAVSTASLTGESSSLTALKGQWLLISVASGGCDAPCQQRLYFQRQLRETLGKDKDRLDRVWLIQDDEPVSPSLMPALIQATVLRVKAQDLTEWLSPGKGELVENHLFLVDPLGNLMMRFPANMDVTGAAKAKRDIERVLRASAFWDTPGR